MTSASASGSASGSGSGDGDGDAGTVIVRPSFAVFRDWILPTAIGGGVALLLLLMFVIFRLPGQRMPLLITIGLLVLGLVAGIRLFFANTRVTVSATGLLLRDAAGRIRSLPLSLIGGVLVIDNLVSNATRRYPRVYVLGTDERRFLGMRGEVWRREDLELVVASLGIPPTEVAEPLTAAALSKRYPGLFGWWERSPLLLGFAILAGIVALAGVVAVIIR